MTPQRCRRFCSCQNLRDQREGFRRGRLLLSARIKEGNGHFLLLRGASEEQEDLVAVAEDVSLERPLLFALVQHRKLSLDDLPTEYDSFAPKICRRLARVVHFHR